MPGEFADDEPCRCGRRDFNILGIDAVVADVRIGHRDDLTRVGRVGEDFLIAGHRGVEDTSPSTSPSAPNAVPVKTVPSSRANLASMMES